MWLSVREQVIEERVFDLKTGNCMSGKAILQLVRRDVRVSFFLFPKKITELICQDTGKKIKKSYWNSEIKQTAEEMKKKLKVPTHGYWIFGGIAFSVLLAVSIGFYSEIKSAKQFQDSFMAQNDQQKKYILESLNTGDLVATFNKVYRITEVTDKNVILVESENPASAESYTDGLSNKNYPEKSFTSKKLNIQRMVFVTGRTSNTDFIVNVLDN